MSTCKSPLTCLDRNDHPRLIFQTRDINTGVDRTWRSQSLTTSERVPWIDCSTGVDGILGYTSWTNASMWIDVLDIPSTLE
jgi:hypothetical protein